MLNFIANLNSANPISMIPLIASAGFIDGIHPCAIAILLFFIAFLLTLRRSFKNILFLGVVYISVIYLTYLAVGIGLFSGVVFFGQPHFFAKLGSWLLIIFGLLHINNALFPQMRINFKIPLSFNDKARELLQKATLPAIIAAAFLVALCSIPCSGGVYAVITAFLASKTTFFVGFLYLLLYNLMFVMPLFIILVLSANPYTLVKLGEWQQTNKKMQNLVMGLAMAALGAVILIFLI